MDAVTDNYDGEVYGDTDPNNLPKRGGQDASASDGLQGYPLDGQTGWRAGAFRAGAGLLGMARVSDLVARPGDGQAQLMPVSDPVMDWEQNSWRWNDPEAIAYDLDRKKRQLAEAQRINDGADAVSGGQLGLGVYGKVARGAAMAESLGLSAGTYVLGQYMNRAEIPRIQGEIDAMQTRLNQLRGGSRT
jgi:hypothetical protein